MRKAQRCGALAARRDDGTARRQVRQEPYRKFKQFLLLKMIVEVLLEASLRIHHAPARCSR